MNSYEDLLSMLRDEIAEEIDDKATEQALPHVTYLRACFSKKGHRAYIYLLEDGREAEVEEWYTP